MMMLSSDPTTNQTIESWLTDNAPVFRRLSASSARFADLVLDSHAEIDHAYKLYTDLVQKVGDLGDANLWLARSKPGDSWRVTIHPLRPVP